MAIVSRVTSRSSGQVMLSSLQRSGERMQQIQQQLATGRELNRPSDGPGRVISSLQLRSEQARAQQYAQNSQEGLGWLDVADNALQSGLGLLRRAQELAIGAGSPAATAESRAASAAEVRSIREGLRELANTRFGERLVFAGAAQTDAAYDANGRYAGNEVELRRNVADGIRLPITLPGDRAFGPTGSNAFTTLDALANDLENGLPGGIGGSLAQLDTASARMRGALAEIGARVNRVDLLRQRAEDHLVTLKSNLSETEDVDLPKAVVDLQLQESAYKAALSATARAIQPSLLDFLR